MKMFFEILKQGKDLSLEIEIYCTVVYVSMYKWLRKVIQNNVLILSLQLYSLKQCAYL